MENFVLYTDGASRGNPGHAAIGAVCYKENEEIFRISKYIGLTTNNVAEYTGLLAGCQQLESVVQDKMSAVIKISMDSELIVKQMNGLYKVKNSDLKNIYTQVSSLLATFPKVEIKHVFREDNAVADALANEALDQKLW